LREFFQINYVGGKNHAFCQPDTICAQAPQRCELRKLYNKFALKIGARAAEPLKITANNARRIAHYLRE